MRAIHEYRTADEIRNDPDIPNIVARAHTLEKFNQLHANDAPPVPIPDAGERRQLGELRGSLSSACAEWQALDEKEKKFSVWLPAAQEKLRSLECETPPDASDAVIDELNRLARRVQLARAFDGNVGSVRQVINSRVAGAFFALNKLLLKFNTERFPRQFLLAGTSPTNTIHDALAAIDGLLK
jgi:hypothetical protein